MGEVAEHQLAASAREGWSRGRQLQQLRVSVAQKDYARFWVAVKELNLSYYIGETPLFTICTHYGNLI